MQQKILIGLTSAVFASSLTAGAVYGIPIFSGQPQGNTVTQDLVIQNRLTQEKLSETHQQLRTGRTVTSLNSIDPQPQPLFSPIFSSPSSTSNSDLVPVNTNSVNRPLFSGASSNISPAENSQAQMVAISPTNIPPTIVPAANLPTTNLVVVNPLLDLATEVAMNSSINLPMSLPMDLPTEVAANPYLEPETIIEDPSRLTPFQRGVASWYGPGFDGAYTASGEVFDQYAMTAAHPSLPFGTRVLVTNLDSGRSVLVRITDRGPFTGGRVIDLSLGAAESIGMIGSGVADVQISVIER